MNKKLFFAAFSFISAIPAFSQEWAPVNSDWKFHFRSDTANHVTNTVYVDSITFSGTDSIFHLNRIAVDCDTCSDYYPQYLWRNQPQFLQQRMIRKPNDIYRFEDPTVFYLRPRESTGASWLYDSVNSIMATVDDIYYNDVLGVMDSLKRILLSNGDTIILSKSHGIQKFPGGEGHYFLLSGIDGAGLGIQVPGFHDFLDFEEGDVFQYLFEAFYLGDGNHTLTKSTILEKADFGDSLVYEVHNIGFSWQTSSPGYPHDTCYFDEYTQWKFIDSASHFCNRFSDELTSASPVSWGPLFCPVELEWESDSLIGRKVRRSGGWGESLGYVPTDPADPLYHPDLLIMAVDGYELEYKPGLGQVRYMLWIFEFNEWEDLIGYVKNGDTTGKVYEDSLLTDILEIQNANEKISIYPNPARDMVRMIIPEYGPGPCRVSVYDLQGRLRAIKDLTDRGDSPELDVSRLNPGIYFIDVKWEGFRKAFKLIVRR